MSALDGPLSGGGGGGKFSPLDERSSGIATPLSQLLLRGKKPEWVVSPNTYYKEEETVVDGPTSTDWSTGRTTAAASKHKKIYRWVSTEDIDSKPRQLRSVSMKNVNPNKFAPQGANPHELKNKVKEIRKEYFEDKITSGPQSTVLEGITWEEARKIKECNEMNGYASIPRMTAASRGIIQREHQRDTLFYKNYSLNNPFESVTQEDLDKYKRDVQRKNKKSSAYGAYAESEPEMLRERQTMITPVQRATTPPAKPARMSPTQQQQSYSKPHSTDIDDVPEMSSTNKQVLMSQAQPKALSTHNQSDKAPALIDDPLVSKTTIVAPSKSTDYPQRSQSARYPSEKRPIRETGNEM